MRPLLLLIVLLNWAVAFGQEKVLVLPGKLPSAQMDIGRYTTFYEDRSGDTLPLSVIRQRQFRPFDQKRNERTTDSDRSLMVTWLRFSLRNTHLTDTLRLYHDVSAHSVITYYAAYRRIGRAGDSRPPGEANPCQTTVLLTVFPGQTMTYYVQVIDYIYSPMPITSQLYSVLEAFKVSFVSTIFVMPLLLVMAMIAGCLLFMSVYAFYSYWLTRDKANLYYGLYALTSFYFAFLAIDTRFGLGILYVYFPSLSLSPITPSLTTFFYTLFIGRLLTIRQQFPQTWAFLRVLLVVLLAQQMLATAESFYGKPFFSSNLIYQYALMPALLATLVLLTTVVRSSLPIRMYLIAGILSLFGLTFLPMLTNVFIQNVPGRLETFVNYPPFWAILGLATESLFFAFALAHRGQLIELENASLHATYTRKVEEELTQRTQEVQQQSRQLEAQRTRQLQTEFDHKLAGTEMTALRAQMNPHFIFNCLNSIKLYTLQNDTDKASDYLTKFSRLIRLVLENSRADRIPLQNELEALQLYSDLESMRFKQKVRVILHIDPDIDQQEVTIPPLLLQPYVENAIWHGLMHKPEGGTVTVEVSQPMDACLHVEVTDNGIGRARAGELKSKSAGNTKSFGMQVTADRIRMINELYNTHTQAQIFDLVAPDGDPLGTKVVLEIPV